MRAWFCCALIIFLAACDQESIKKDQPASWEGSIGHVVVGGDSLDTAEFVDRRGGDQEEGGQADGAMSIISVADAAFDRALRLETLRLPIALNSLEASLNTKRDIEALSSCWLHLQARAAQPQIETGLARLLIAFQSNEPPDERLLAYEVFIEPTWTPIDLPFVVSDTIDAGAAKLVLGVGTQLQVIDVGDIALRCFGPDNPPADLPKTSFTYAGRADDAPWRVIAAGRIERYRQADLAIKVVDADDQPLPDAEIQVQMTRHAFKFGTAVDPDLLVGTKADGEANEDDRETIARYRKLLQELFNLVTFDKGMGWTSWSDEDAQGIGEEALKWGDSLGLDLRGRSLVPASWADLPAELQDKRDDPEAVRAAIRERIRNTVSALDGRLGAWDIADPPRGENGLIDVLGWEELGEWFRQARAASSDAKLFINENDVLAGDGLVQLAIMLEQLIQQEAPVDAIGIKGHFNEQPPSIQVLSDRLDQLASFDLPMMVTEFDMDTRDRALYADFLRDLMTLTFSHPSIEGFCLEGFWEGQQAAPGSSLYEQDWSITAAGEVYRDLVLRQWWTDDVARSNAEGDLVTRGFLGDYIVTARQGDLSATQTLTLDRDGASITLKLEKSSSG